jgi:hypothetical protein
LLGGDGEGFADAQSIKVVNGILKFLVVHLVHGKNNGFFGAA